MLKQLIPFFSFLVLISLNAAYAATQAEPVYIAEDDHKACLRKGFSEGKMEDPGTEHYYLCRAELARNHMPKSTGILSKINLTEIQQKNQLTEIAKDFESKAKTAHKAAADNYQQAFTLWDNKQAEMAKRFDERDNRTCLQAISSPLSWGNPDTEKYYTCRAELIHTRTTPLLVPNPQQIESVSRAEQFFEKKAQEAEYAFKIIDEQTHHTCMEKGGIPGSMDDPKTKLYYECRANLAEEQMGSKIALLFRQKVEESNNAIAETSLCAERGIKKDSPHYQQCRTNVGLYKRCLSAIDRKIEKKMAQGKVLCTEEAMEKFPKSSATKARQKSTDDCIMQKESLRNQYRAGFKLECTEALTPVLAE